MRLIDGGYRQRLKELVAVVQTVPRSSVATFLCHNYARKVPECLPVKPSTAAQSQQLHSSFYKYTTTTISNPNQHDQRGGYIYLPDYLLTDSKRAACLSMIQSKLKFLKPEACIDRLGKGFVRLINTIYLTLRHTIHFVFTFSVYSRYLSQLYS